MPTLYPLQESFSAGELSPRLLGKPSAKAYREGVQAMENMLALAQGPAKRRPGFRFAFEVPALASHARLIPFPIESNKYYILVFYHGGLYIINPAGHIIAPEMVVNGTFKNGWESWHNHEGNGASIVFTLLTCSIYSVPSWTAGIAQTVAGFSVGSSYRISVTQLSPLDVMRINVGTTPGAGEVLSIDSYDEMANLDFIAPASTLYVTVYNPISGTTLILTNISVQANGTPAPIATAYSEDVLSTLQYDIDPSNTTMYVASSRYPVCQVVWTGASFTFGQTSFTAPPSEWAANNYPRCVAFFQGRLWFAGTTNQPSKFWASKSGQYTNFTLGTLADDALAYTIAKRGAIRWIIGAKNLLVGTENTEFVVSASGGAQDVITPTSINLEPQSAYGSIYSQPALLGNVVLYFSADARKLYSMGYRFEESGWVSVDMTLASEHITRERVLFIAYAQRPESIVWGVTASGQLIGANYERSNNIIGWHRHPAQVPFVSITTVKSLGTDVTWAAWRILRGAQNFIQVGAIDEIDGDGPFQDAWHQVILPSPGSSISGFQHLAGWTVDVIADGAVHPPVTVTGAGVINLAHNAKTIVAGLSNSARLLTMPFEPGQSPQSEMTAFKRFSQAYIHVLSSSKPFINGIRPPDRTPATRMDTREPYLSAKFLTVKLGYANSETIEIIEPLPLSLTVVSIFGDLADNKL